jgi:dihydroorotase
MSVSNGPADLLLKGGRVIDPANGVDAPLDLAIKDGKISQVALNLPAADATTVLDVSGRYVTPGLIDIHVHAFVGHSRSNLSVLSEAHAFPSGVTTVVDAGTAGWRDFPLFKEQVIDRSKIRILSFVNIVGSGMGGEWEHDGKEMNPRLAADVVAAYPDVAVGVKTAHYWALRPFDEMHPPWLAVDRAIEAAELCDKPVMFDFCPWPEERPYKTLLLEKMRPGDIHTHVFAQQFRVLDDHGKVQDFMWAARERGVIFDLGHGAGSFWFRNAVPAIQQGFKPDSISTDLHTGNINGTVFDMLTTVNKCMTMGLPLADVIARSTVAPAREIGHPELGTLTPGADADVAVFRLEHGSFRYADCGRAILTGSQQLVCVLTLRAGAIVYNPMAMGLPPWQEAPDRYWWDPARQASTRPVAAP